MIEEKYTNSDGKGLLYWLENNLAKIEYKKPTAQEFIDILCGGRKSCLEELDKAIIKKAAEMKLIFKEDDRK